MCGYASTTTSNGQQVRFKKTSLKLPRAPGRGLAPVRTAPSPEANDYEVRLA